MYQFRWHHLHLRLWCYTFASNMKINKNNRHRSPIPLWFGILATVSFIPVLVWPWMVAASDALKDPGNMTNLLLLTFPIYAVLSIYISYRCLGERTYVAIILIVLLWLSFGALWML